MFPLLLLYPEISSHCQSILYNRCVVKFMIFYNVILSDECLIHETG